ncbi:hypothetical protein FHR24_001371 [Wenyingzhuangia heitensis]|uniref:Pyridoxamine 5'-phosphate oxidase putative domain-containing protein n=1 Tax=Wenyingzhuangia heitensis TaxID=1487859 RepID=A0ABX0U7V0_9FLAO|nr:pyridoxamine 5'-phosphate oxidase family protein [Wenyingzhuangia heitensis]NIJ44932.1 hypothetical protein [Wenyingzhuangia heitensis]
MFHKGELAFQKKMGVDHIAHKAIKMISNEIIKGAIPFIEKQTMAIVSSQDKEQNVWISILLGANGFVAVPTPSSLTVNLTKIVSDKKDVFYKNIQQHTQIGTLFIELATRRRLRVNGVLTVNGENINIKVEESYPNCPKYIQQRDVQSPINAKQNSSIQKHGNVLTDAQKDWILKADTLFVGSAGLDGKLDASHRGGTPGFIDIIDDNILKIPDYKGNNIYNTFGNFTENSKGGVLFIDFENKSTLQLTGTSKIIHNLSNKDDLSKSGGTGRFWFFKIDKWIETQNHHNSEWSFISYSKYNPEENKNT